jgi:hypothetical protein
MRSKRIVVVATGVAAVALVFGGCRPEPYSFVPAHPARFVAPATATATVDGTPIATPGTAR